MFFKLATSEHPEDFFEELIKNLKSLTICFDFEVNDFQRF